MPQNRYARKIGLLLLNRADTADMRWGLQIRYICDAQAITDHLCTQSELGSFIINVPESERNTTSIFNKAFTLSSNDTDGAIYEISKSGYYCVALVPVENSSGTLGKFGAWVEWRFPYGELPAVDYPKLVVSFRVFEVATALDILLLIPFAVLWSIFIDIFNYWSLLGYSNL